MPALPAPMFPTNGRIIVYSTAVIVNESTVSARSNKLSALFDSNNAKLPEVQAEEESS